MLGSRSRGSEAAADVGDVGKGVNVNEIRSSFSQYSDGVY